MRAFSQLPSEQKEALILTASEFSYDEAAQICGCAVGTIKSRVSRARKQLQVLVEGSAGQLPDRRAPTDDLAEALFRKVREANTEKLPR
jgi:RNA polymerase sigma-70 factor, ECF subfamily